MLKTILPKLAHLAIMFVLGFVIYYFWLNPNNVFKMANNDESKLSTQTLFTTNLPDENGVSQALSQYQGKIIVLNFWATWCPPCREEMPELSELHKEYQAKNVVVLGIAIDEQAQVKMFRKEMPVSYPLFAAEEEGMSLASNLGNNKGVLPYTVIIDNKGKVIKTYFGRINKPLLAPTLNSLLPH
ncbi:MAG: TlpA family protein disulfide reductase [Methylotenera sp.]|nr:TlpA family protein disulfide reductase [Methylotenera sp.]